MMKTKSALMVLLVLTNIHIFGQNNDQTFEDLLKVPWSSDSYYSIENDYLEWIDLDMHEDRDVLQEKVLDFCRSQTSREIWGVGNRIDYVYDREYLPAFFDRELIFDKLEIKDGILRWVFTGNNGGWTIQVSKDTVYVYQRWYDSMGLLDVRKNKVRNYTSPNRIWQVSATAIKGEIKTIRVRTDYAYQLVVELNGKEISRQFTKIDAFREQVQFEGEMGEICGEIRKPAIDYTRIEIDPEISHQEILGFGGIVSIPAYNELSAEGKKKWWQLIKEYNLLIQREYPVGQMLNPGFSNWDSIEYASPHYYGDNFPNGEISDFSFSKKIMDAGGLVTFEFWKLPDGTLNPDGTINTEIYTGAILSYCKALKKETGHYPAIVGIQNEQEQTAENWRDMTLSLRSALDEEGMENVKIHMYNSSRAGGAIKAVQAFRKYPGVWESIDYAASNMYDQQRFLTEPWRYDSVLIALKEEIGDKPFLSTELCINDNKYQGHTYRTAFSMALLYHKNMALVDAISLQYCWTLLNTPQQTYDMSRSLMGIDEKNGFVPDEQGYQLRTFGAFSRHLPAGSTRIHAISDHDDLLVTAYNTTDGIVSVILNKGLTPINIRSNIFFQSMEVAGYSQPNTRTDIPKDLIIQPGEVVTLTGGYVQR